MSMLILLHCVKKRHWCFALQLQRTSTDFGNFWQRCCWESMLSNGDLLSHNVSSALPEETWTPEIVSFQSCWRWPTTQLQAFSSDVALLRIARRTVAIVLQVDWRRYNEQFFVREDEFKSTARSESSVVIETRYRARLKRHNLGVYLSPGNAETLVRRGGITNHHLIAYSLNNISAKNYQNQLMCIEIIHCVSEKNTHSYCWL